MSSSSSTPSDASPSLQQLLPPQGCDVCNRVPPASPDPNRRQQQRRQLTVSDDQNGLLGLLAWNPHIDEHNPASSIHQRINTDGLNHPCLILAQSPCGHQVFCAQVTSFGGTGILTKYGPRGNGHSKGQLEMLDEYISLCLEGKTPRSRHNQLGELVYTGSEMRQPSYAHLDMGLWIDWRSLTRWGGGRKLTAESLSLATELYIAAERKRQASGGGRAQERLGRAAHSRSPRRPTSSPSSSGSVANPSSNSSPSGSSSSLTSFGENARPTPASSPVRSSQSPPWRSRDATVARQQHPPSPTKKELMQSNWRGRKA